MCGVCVCAKSLLTQHLLSRGVQRLTKEGLKLFSSSLFFQEMNGWKPYGILWFQLRSNLRLVITVVGNHVKSLIRVIFIKDTYHTSLRNLVEMRLIERFFNTVILIYLWSTEA